MQHTILVCVGTLEVCSSLIARPDRFEMYPDRPKAVALGCGSVLGGSGVDGGTAMAIFVVTLTHKRR